MQPPKNSKTIKSAVAKGCEIVNLYAQPNAKPILRQRLLLFLIGIGAGESPAIIPKVDLCRHLGTTEKRMDTCIKTLREAKVLSVVCRYGQEGEQLPNAYAINLKEASFLLKKEGLSFRGTW